MTDPVDACRDDDRVFHPNLSPVICAGRDHDQSLGFPYGLHAEHAAEKVAFAQVEIVLLVDVIDVSQHIDVGKAHLDFRFDHRLRADYVHFAGEAYADDRGGFARRMSFERRVDDQVYSLPDILRNFTVRARSGLTRDVGRGGYQRPVQLADQLLAELVLGNPDAERTLLGIRFAATPAAPGRISVSGLSATSYNCHAISGTFLI